MYVVDQINDAVKKLREKQDYIKFQQHIGGGCQEILSQQRFKGDKADEDRYRSSTERVGGNSKDRRGARQVLCRNKERSAVLLPRRSPEPDGGVQLPGVQPVSRTLLSARKRVTFEDRVTVHIIEVEDRRSQWPQMARDRHRFQQRIRHCETIIGPVLTDIHRLRILIERLCVI